MEITPRELRDVEIHEQFRGYNRDEVNDLLERAADSLDGATERIRQLSERLSSAQTDAGRSRETEDILHRTLLLAQRAADEAVAEAQAKARQLLDDAEITSRKVLAEVEADARRRGEVERRRLEDEVVDLAGRRDALLADVEALTRFEAEYRERMTRALDADLAALRTRPSAAPGNRPEPSDVEIPTMSEAIARREEAEPTTNSAPAEASYDQATREVDVRALFEADEPGAGESEPPPPPAPAIDLLGDEALEAEVLDDDAFFATLREAVHDDTPLGPRDDDHNFFDDDERGSLRDVFRRRR